MLHRESTAPDPILMAQQMLYKYIQFNACSCVRGCCTVKALRQILSPWRRFAYKHPVSTFYGLVMNGDYFAPDSIMVAQHVVIQVLCLVVVASLPNVVT
jgi:hypothetical protein